MHKEWSSIAEFMSSYDSFYFKFSVLFSKVTVLIFILINSEWTTTIPSMARYA